MRYRVVPSLGVDKWKKTSGSINKLNQLCIFESELHYGIPMLDVYRGEIPKELSCWHDTAVKRSFKSVENSFVHFFIDDYYFESVWSSPKHLMTVSKGVRGVLGTTYSVYERQPKAMNIWNTYRNRWVCKYLETQGVQVIPAVIWADKSTWDYCFEGLPCSSVLAVSTVGTYRKNDRKLFQLGFKEMLHRVNPKTLLVYGEYKPVTFDDYVDHVVYYQSEWAKKRERIKLKEI